VSANLAGSKFRERKESSIKGLRISKSYYTGEQRSGPRFYQKGGERRYGGRFPEGRQGCGPKMRRRKNCAGGGRDRMRETQTTKDILILAKKDKLIVRKPIWF